MDKAGGKGRNLLELERLGLRVPAWFAIEPDLPDEQVRARVEARPFDREALLAVRSSAPDEDSARHSFAGVHKSILFVRGTEAIVEAIRAVRASAHTDRALAYRREHGFPVDSVDIAALVQEMVIPRTSGVAFSVDPISGDVGHVVINSLWGAGEALVGRGFEADTFRVSKADGTVTGTLADKREQITLRHRAAVTTGVPAEKRTAPSLTEDEARAVAEAAQRIERHFRRPQDIEFVFDDAGYMHILQTRPVTTVEEYGPAAGNHMLWDNTHIMESYAGVTLPFTFSFIRDAYAVVYRNFCRSMGVGKSVIEREQPMFRRLLGLFRGQVYYNVESWYRLVSLFPGSRFNRTAFDAMMGVRGPLPDDVLPARRSLLRRYGIELPGRLRIAVRSWWRFARLDRDVARFLTDFQKRVERFESRDFKRLSAIELIEVYRELERGFLARWKIPIVNDFYVMVQHGALKNLCASWCDDRGGSLHNNLLSGEGGLDSTQATRVLRRLAEQARRDPILEERILHDSPEQLAREIPLDPRFALFASQIESYLHHYGTSGMGELKLEGPTLRDRPAFVYGFLRNYVATPPTETDPQALRHAAEKRVFGMLGTLRAMIFRRVLKNARRAVRNRENLRFARTRIFGVIRDLTRALGRALAHEGVLANADDIFLLTINEVRDYLYGTAVTVDLRRLVDLRREEFDYYRGCDAPADHFDTYGMPYHRNRFHSEPELAETIAGDLQGVACCPGRVAGPVKVITNPHDDMRLAGEILVAGRTDPGWVPLYPSARGLLIERGSVLSHSAIVAREMGLPTIVGIPGLLDRLRDGQYVEMDGATGSVVCDEST